MWHGREMLTNWLQRNSKKGSLRKSDVFFQLRQKQDGSLVFPNTPEPLRYGFAGTGLHRLPADADEKKTFGDMVTDDVISIPDLQ